MAIADRRPDQPAPGRAHRPLEATVAHHGDHEDVVAEGAGRQPGQRADPHDGVAVHQLPALVDGDQAICVAVEREPEVEPRGGHRLGKALRMGRAAPLVDVRPVRRREENGDLGTQRAEQVRCDLAGRAVGAVDPDPQPAEGIPGDLDQMTLVRGRSAVGARPSNRSFGRWPIGAASSRRLLELVLLAGVALRPR